MSNPDRHPASPPSNSKIVPPYIPPPKKDEPVKRYTPCTHRSSDNGMTEATFGDWVSHDDYEKLRQKYVESQYRLFLLAMNVGQPTDTDV